MIGMYLVLAAGLFVQLIASANVANLLLVKATGQRHDTAVRYALGARRSDVLRQSLVETLIVCAAGGALGLALGDRRASRGSSPPLRCSRRPGCATTSTGAWSRSRSR